MNKYYIYKVRFVYNKNLCINMNYIKQQDAR